MALEIQEIVQNSSHLYIHVPFCKKKCPYCDFYSVEGSSDWFEPYTEAILRELKCSPLREGQFETIYLGGGTPTVLGPVLISRLFETVSPQVHEEAEITVEANPATITRDIAKCLKEACVNRVSLGVQSFDNGLRASLGRQGNDKSIYIALENLRSAGFENISIDLLFGIPGQEMDDLKRDVDKALSLEPAHVSYYELTVKQKDYAYTWSEKLKSVKKMNAVFYEYVIDRLEQAGYLWYETSNFSLPGRQCRHNVAYWEREDFLGIGAGAWSTIGHRRWMNVADLQQYINFAGRSHKARLQEFLSTEKIELEYLMLGLRHASGIERDKVEGVIDEIQESMLILNGLLANRDGKIILTREGRYLADEVCARLVRSKV